MVSARFLSYAIPGIALMAQLTLSPAIAADKKALIVSINEYPREAWKLKGAINDGRNFEALLKQSFGFRDDQILRLFDKAASKRGILDKFQTWLVDGTKPGDEVFFYFSGHGSQQPDANGDEEDGLDETLVAADVAVVNGRVENMVIDDELEALISRLKGRKINIVIDSCHSGTVTRGMFEDQEGQRSLPLVEGMTRPQPVSTRAVARHRGERAVPDMGLDMTVWTAVAANQLALEEVDAHPISGVFTNRFIKGVGGKQADANHDGVVSVAELQGYLQKESDAYCRAHAHCRAGLTPTVEAPPSRLTSALGQGAEGTSVASASGGAGASGQPTLVAHTGNPAPPVQNAATSLLSNDNQGGVEIAISPRTSVTVGSAVRFTVSSRWDGKLIVMDVNAKGELVQIYPNEFSQKNNKSNWIRANQTITIPDATYGFEFTASEPLGKGLLIALVLQDPIDVSAQTDAHRDLTPIAAPVDYMAQIAERLRKPWIDGATTRMARWSMTSLAYEITR